ncbi:MAG: hypothetical protein GX072_12235 [Lysinibacillus sp.]|nr:hypothetical protein [Lysinibacillus sp.]
MHRKLIGVKGDSTGNSPSLDTQQDRMRREGSSRARGKRPRNGNQFSVKYQKLIIFS